MVNGNALSVTLRCVTQCTRNEHFQCFRDLSETAVHAPSSRSQRVGLTVVPSHWNCLATECVAQGLSAGDPATDRRVVVGSLVHSNSKIHPHSIGIRCRASATFHQVFSVVGQARFNRVMLHTL